MHDGSFRVIERGVGGGLKVAWGLNPEMRNLYQQSPTFREAVDGVVECFAVAAQLPDDEYSQFLEWVQAHLPTTASSE